MATPGHARAPFITAEGGGRLVYLPGELIPFQRAVYRQETVVEVVDGGSVAMGEILTPGRVAMGERDRYTRLEFRLRASVEGKVVLIERGVLEPGCVHWIPRAGTGRSRAPARSISSAADGRHLMPISA